MTYTGSQAINVALADLRDRLATGDGLVQSTMPAIDPAKFSIGQNVVFHPSAASAFTNLVTGAYWQGNAWSGDVNGVYSAGQAFCDSMGDLRGAPALKINLRGMQAPPIDGQLTEVSWLEPNNTTGISNWAIFPKTFPEAELNWPETTPITFSNGRFRMRGKYTVSPTNPRAAAIWKCTDALPRMIS